MRTRRTRRALALLGVVAGLAVFAVPAHAAEDSMVVRRVDTTDFPTVRISTQVTGAEPDLSAFGVLENEAEVEDVDVAPLSSGDTQVGIVLAVDTSSGMADENAMESVKTAARTFVEERLPNDRIALVAFGGERPRTLVGLTDDSSRLLEEIDGLSPDGGTSLWDAVRSGAELLADKPELQPNMVVFSGSTDTSSAATPEDARAAAVAVGAPVSIIGLLNEDGAEEPAQSLADGTGGTYLAATDADAVPELGAEVQSSLQNQFELTYTSSSEAPVLDLVVHAGDLRATAVSKIGTVSEGAAVNPTTVPPESGLLTGDVGKMLAGVFVALAAGLLAYGVISALSKDESTLDRMLRPYEDKGPVAEDSDESASLVETPLLKRAVAMTEGFATRQGLLPRVENALERADLPFRAAEALFFYGVAVLVLSVLALAVTPSFVIGLALVPVIAAAPIVTVSYVAGRRRRLFLSQLPDTLQLLAGSLRAGYSLMQGVEAVSQEVDDPMGKELRRVLAESRLGRPLEQSLDEAAERMASPDFAWAVMAIRIQREVGGNLSELLQTVAETMVARERLRREVKALTAEGRISAIVLGLLPVGIGLAVYAINREYMQVLFTDRVGQYLLGGSIVLALIGFWWMKKTIEIEV